MKKIKIDIQSTAESDYFHPATKNANKVYEKEHKFFWKIRKNRDNQILNADGKFKWTKENKQKLLMASDISHQKYLELVERIRNLEKKMDALAEDYPDYSIEAKLCCALPLPNGDEISCVIATEHSCKKHPFTQDDWVLNKEGSLPIRQLMYENTSYPFYCLIDEGRMSFAEVANLKEDEFYIEIKIELE